jgi:hypothetical protein
VRLNKGSVDYTAGILPKAQTPTDFEDVIRIVSEPVVGTDEISMADATDGLGPSSSSSSSSGSGASSGPGSGSGSGSGSAAAAAGSAAAEPSAVGDDDTEVEMATGTASAGKRNGSDLQSPPKRHSPESADGVGAAGSPETEPSLPNTVRLMGFPAALW